MASTVRARPRWPMRWRRWSPHRAATSSGRASTTSTIHVVRYARGRYSPDGFFLDSYDYAAFCRLLLDPLGPGGSGNYVARHFDHRTDRPVASHPQQAAPAAALIVDGIFLHRVELRDYWDLSIFLHVDFAVSRERNATRDGAPDALDPRTPSNRRYAGGQQRYLRECRPAQRAAIVIDYNDLRAPEILKWWPR